MDNERNIGQHKHQKNTELVFMLAQGKVQFERRRRREPTTSREISLVLKSMCEVDWRRVNDGIEIRSKDEPFVVAVVKMPAIWRDRIWEDVYQNASITYDDLSEDHQQAIDELYLGIQIVLAERSWRLLSTEIRATDEVQE